MPRYLSTPEIGHPEHFRPGTIVTYRWETNVAFLNRRPPGVRQIMRRDSYECCGCHQATPHSDTWNVFPVDTDNVQAGPAYTHCSRCMMASPAAPAWASARAADLTRRGVAPAPARDAVASDSK